MQTLQLIPAVHQQQPIVKAIFAYDKEIIGLVKSQKGARWSQTMKTWYFPKDEFQLHTFFQALKGKVFIDYSELKTTTNSVPIKKSANRRSTSDLQLPQGYREQLILKRYGKNTIKTYSSCFLAFMAYFKEKKLETITKNEIKNYILYLIEQKKVSPSTQNQYINAIKFHYEKVLRQPKMVFEIERPRKRNHLPKVLSEDAVLQLLKATKNLKHKAITSLLYASGLRVGEVINLKLDDLNFHNNTVLIRQSKGFKDRISLLGKSTASVLKKYLEIYQPVGFLFEGQLGGKYSPRSINKFLKQNAKRAGITTNISAHVLRHSFATHLLNNGTDIRFIQELLGHSSTKTTERYTHVTTRVLEQIESPIDRIIKDVASVKEHVKSNTNEKNIKNISEPITDIH